MSTEVPQSDGESGGEDGEAESNHADPRPFKLQYSSNRINARAFQRFESREAAEAELSDLRDTDRIRTGIRFRGPSIDFKPRY